LFGSSNSRLVAVLSFRIGGAADAALGADDDALGCGGGDASLGSGAVDAALGCDDDDAFGVFGFALLLRALCDVGVSKSAGFFAGGVSAGGFSARNVGRGVLERDGLPTLPLGSIAPSTSLFLIAGLLDGLPALPFGSCCASGSVLILVVIAGLLDFFPVSVAVLARFVCVFTSIPDDDAPP
jgi:hypothetical protein